MYLLGIREREGRWRLKEGEDTGQRLGRERR
jgi:hypothetical protein